MSDELLLKIKEKVCRLILQENKYFEDQMKLQAEDEGIEWQPGMFGSKDTPWSNADLEEQWNDLGQLISKYKWKYEKLMCRVATNKEWRDLLTPWMVDISGVAIGPERERQEQELKDGMPFEEVADGILFGRYESIQDFVSNYGGANFDEMLKFLRDNGFNPTDMGAGVRGWDVGCPCGDDEANRLCDLLHENFADEIQYGQLKISKNFWGFRFPDLYNDGYASDYAKEHSLKPDENGNWMQLE